ncbi:hypothetical protein BYT27DRAFT_7260461 [Phlegmacium glaucopus]|nr:hypothetical protein BYT27DRAFT_7260461 [Phlegmacium glaucopus]
MSPDPSKRPRGRSESPTKTVTLSTPSTMTSEPSVTFIHPTQPIDIYHHLTASLLSSTMKNFYPSPPSFGQSHPLPSSFTRHRSVLPATTQLCPPSTRPPHRHPTLSTVPPDYPPVTHRNRPLPTTTTFADHNRLLSATTDFCPPQPTSSRHG